MSAPLLSGRRVDWLLPELSEPSKVVEVGAGTGTFTAQLVERDVTVLAVEPVAAMREDPANASLIDALERRREPLRERPRRD